MAKEKTCACKYYSKKGGGYITAAQFLTERLMINYHASKNIELPDLFWKHEKWTKTYRTQIQFVNQLLKLYSTSIIFAAINDSRCRNIFSFRAPWLKPILLEYDKKAELIAKNLDEYIVPDYTIDTSQQRQPFGQPSLKSKLNG